MINLQEHLSEFSYGYGVTREVESLLASVGLHATPFLPNLVHEKDLGFDVAYSSSGTIVLLQFKLGNELSRFRRQYPLQPIPALMRPFWRFDADLDGHQFQRLTEFEAGGAQVYYVAPRFSNWRQYAGYFERSKVLENSLLVTPGDVAAAAGGGSGKHRVVYDRYRRYVCSEPRDIPEIGTEVFLDRVSIEARNLEVSLSERLKRLVDRPSEGLTDSTISRRRRAVIRKRAKRPEDAWATMVGLDAWTQGAQLIMVTPTLTDSV